MTWRGTPKYMIGVAAELLGMHPQTLRMYEQRGLIRPRRTPGGPASTPTTTSTACGA